MNNNTVYWVPVFSKVIHEKREPWDAISFPSLYEDLFVAQRRVIKDVGVTSERSRHAIVCSSLENAFLEMSIVTDLLSSRYVQSAGMMEYIDLISFLSSIDHERSVRCFVGSTFLHTNIAQEQFTFLKDIWNECAGVICSKKIDRILNDRLRYLQHLIQTGAHSFEMPFCLQSGDNGYAYHIKFIEKMNAEHFDPFEQDQASHILSDDAWSVDRSMDEHITDHRGKIFMDIAKEHVAQYISAAQNDGGVNVKITLADYPHDVITELLHDLMYTRDHGDLSLPVVYSDGSRSRSLVMGCLDKVSERDGQNMHIMHIGMISERHTELDNIVSMYWFLNMEVSGRGHTGAETEIFCYRRSREMLQSIQQQGKDMCIYFYQTGFPFAVIGFYRALIEFLVEQRKVAAPVKLCVVPMYFRGDANPYEEGKVWM